MERTCSTCDWRNRLVTVCNKCENLDKWEQLPQEPSPKSERTEGESVRDVLVKFKNDNGWYVDESESNKMLSDYETRIRAIVAKEFTEILDIHEHDYCMRCSGGDCVDCIGKIIADKILGGGKANENK